MGIGTFPKRSGPVRRGERPPAKRYTAWSEVAAPVVIELRGLIPSKKNRLQPRKGGGLMNDPAVQAMMDGFELQAKSQWRRDPLEHADIKATFYVKDGASDLDGKFTFALDVLVKVGILANDSIKRVWHIEAWAIPLSFSTSDEWCELELRP